MNINIWFKNGSICTNKETGVVTPNGNKDLCIISEALRVLKDTKKEMENIISKNNKEETEIKNAIKILANLSLFSASSVLRRAEYEIGVKIFQAKDAIEKIDESIELVLSRKSHFVILHHQKKMRHLQHQKGK